MIQQAVLPLLDDPYRPAPPSIGPAQVAMRPNSKVLNTGKGALEGLDYALNPYVGCSFGCSYCYAAAFVADERRRADWGNWVDVKEDALREIARADLKGKKVMMSSATDPYQPIEAKLLHTRAIVEMMSEPIRQPRLGVQTRSPLVTRDIDLLQRYFYARVGMSITTDSEEIRKRFEPGCASIDRRFEALEECARAGLVVAVSVAPTLPISDPARFAKRIRALNPSWVHVQKFHKTDRPFAADTRPDAFRIAREVGWTQREYDKVVAELRKWLPQIREGKGGYLPA